MSKVKYLILIVGFILSSSLSFYGQENVAYAQNRIIALFNDHVEVDYKGKNEIVVLDPQLEDLLVNLNVSSIKALARGAKHKTTRHYSQPIVIEFNQNIDIISTIDILKTSAYFKVVEADFTMNGEGICSISNNDTYFYKQWGLKNNGTFNANAEVDADIDMNNAWTITTGDTSVIISVLDSGTKLNHPELNPRLFENETDSLNEIDDDLNGYIDDSNGWDFVNDDKVPIDDHGHGTNVIGILGATGNNSSNYAGVDWKSKLMTCKVLNANNSGFYSWMVDAIYYSVDNGADVINMSIVGSSSSILLENAVDYAYDNNVVIVACMGNANSSSTYYPAGFTNTIAVGATDTDNDRVDPFFWGGGSSYGNHIDVVAPGNYIYGLSHMSNITSSNYWGGTSQSTPLVAGVAALLKGLNSELSVDSIRSLINLGATDQEGDPAEDVEGWDQYYGYGVLNAYNTLLLATAEYQNSCDPVLSSSGNQLWDSSGFYLDTLLSSTGCDSVFMINLDYGGGGYFDQNIYACESYLSPSGELWTESGFYQDTLYAETGCVSYYEIDLSIHYPSATDQTIEACDSFESPSGKYIWTESGVYIDTLQALGGCDSIITIDLSVYQSPTTTRNINACDSYTSYNGEVVWIESGIYVDTIPSNSECDSLVTINLNISSSSYSYQNLMACGTYIPPSGNYEYTSTGTYLDTIANSQGCDSILSIHVLIFSLPELNLEVVSCGDYESPSGNYIWSESGIYTDTVQVDEGCDTVVSVDLTIPFLNTDLSFMGGTLILPFQENEIAWINCDNNEIIPFENESEFTPNENGNYAAIVSNGSCTDTSDCINVIMDNVNKISSLPIDIYPNPAEDRIFIDLGTYNQSGRLEIHSLNGQLVQAYKFNEQKKFSLDLSIEKGVYTIDFIFNDGLRKSVRFVKL